MKAKERTTGIPPGVVMNKIFIIRGHKVMLGIDLAELYRVETRQLNQSVRRNRERFPEDFMFQLTPKEWHSLRSQFVISNDKRGGRRYAPFAFTEHGVPMLSSVLNSDRAIRVNIQIMRIYTRLKEVVMDHKDITICDLKERTRIDRMDVFYPLGSIKTNPRASAPS